MYSFSGDSGRYYLHTFRIRSSDDAVIFTADSPNTFPFGFSTSVRLYMHFKFTHSVSGDDSAVFKLREPSRELHSLILTDLQPTTGWTAPSIHASITGLANSAPSGNYVETTLPDSTVSNTDNDAQVSWVLDIGTRYHLQTTQYDNNSDFEIYLEAREDDNGSSWNTTYSSSDSFPIQSLSLMMMDYKPHGTTSLQFVKTGSSSGSKILQGLNTLFIHPYPQNNQRRNDV